MLTALVGVGGAGAPALAQFFEAPRYYRVEPPPQPTYQQRRAPPMYQPAPGGGYYYYPPEPVPQPRRRAVQPRAEPAPAPQPTPGSSLRRLFGLDDDDRPAQVQPRPQQAQPRPRPAVAKQEKPKVETQAFVMVFGDGLADATGQGLVDALDEMPDVEVVRRTRGDGGLVRMDVTDWPKLIGEALTPLQKPAVAVMMVGTNDRQPIREGDVSHEPLSDRWRELYRERVDAVVRAFRERGTPFVWIGTPPVRSERATADIIAMNEIYRDRVERGGGVYVDIWPGFVDDDNRYAASGPDIAGQVTRLRANDGVNLTRAGARKVAFFADADVKRLVEAKRNSTAVAALPPADAAKPADAPAAPTGAPNAGAPPAATPPAGSPPTGTPPADATASPPAGGPTASAAPAVAAPAAPAPPPVPAKPVAGPVVPLTRPEVTPGGTLVTSRPRLEGEAAQAVQKTLRDGVAVPPRPGRADDFRWPKS